MRLINGRRIGKNYTSFLAPGDMLSLSATRPGEGMFGTVHLAVDCNSGNMVACKTIKKAGLALGPKGKERLGREAQILQNLDHPNICKLYTHHEDQSTIRLILEYIRGGTLSELIDLGLDQANDVFDPAEEEVQRLTREVCSAVAYLHSRSIVHRDLKPENIMVTEDNPPHIKLVDFGLAKSMSRNPGPGTVCGTRAYAAPEILLGLTCDHLTDSWSVGVTVLEMLRNPTLPGPPRDILLLEEQRVDLTQAFPPACSPECIDWIQRMLKFDPRQRMGITQALEHPWLASSASPQNITSGIQQQLTPVPLGDNGHFDPPGVPPFEESHQAPEPTQVPRHNYHLRPPSASADSPHWSV
ncbi:hypothetical protein FRC11_004602 [Ceratobasidium sp. 423]|nr:hypothetical protein FRC11_004602 [Ceratobasidium sp. 423]